MARRKKQESEEIKELWKIVAGMKAIDPAFDAGTGVTLAVAEALINEGIVALDECNQAVAVADDKDNIYAAKNKKIRAFKKKVLPAGGLKYGTDSSEYEMLGGVRDSERKKPVRKPNVG